MSGGVDSSVAAALTVEAGYECMGVTMKLYDNGDVNVTSERPAAPFPIRRTPQASAAVSEFPTASLISPTIFLPALSTVLSTAIKKAKPQIPVSTATVL